MRGIDSYGISMTKQVTIHKVDGSGRKHCLKQILYKIKSSNMQHVEASICMYKIHIIFTQHDGAGLLAYVHD